MSSKGQEEAAEPIKVLNGNYVLVRELLEHTKWSSATVVPSVAKGNNIWIGQHTKGWESLIVKCRKVNSKTKIYHKNELECLRRLGKAHKHITKLLDWSNGPTNVDRHGIRTITIYEHAPHGSLADALPSKGGFQENVARTYFQQIASAVDFCHRNRICHTDVCLENVFLDANYVAKLGSFGRAVYGGVGTVLSCKHVLGNQKYTLDPAVNDNGSGTYNALMGDVWSLGVVCFTLLTGYPPFNRDAGKNHCWWLNSLFEGDAGVERFWHNQKLIGFNTDNAIPLIQGLLKAEPKDRPSAYAAKFDPWVVNGNMANPTTLAAYMRTFCPKITGLGLEGQSFRQNEAYDSRLRGQTGVERYKYLYKNDVKDKAFDNVNRTAIAQLGIARTKQLAEDKGIYPKLEEMWLKACDNQITIKPPEGEIITMYMQNNWTIRDVLEGVQKRRGYDANHYLITTCGTRLAEDMVIGEHKLFSRQDTVFRLFSKTFWEKKEVGKQKRKTKRDIRDSIVLSLEAIFKTLDADESGILERHEVIDGLTTLSEKNGIYELLKELPGLTILRDARLWEEAFRVSDAGGKGGLTLLEFSMFARKLVATSGIRTVVRQIFDHLDPLDRGILEKESLLTACGGNAFVREKLHSTNQLKILKKPGLYSDKLTELETDVFGHLSFEETVQFSNDMHRRRGNIGDPDADKNNTESRAISWTEGKWSFTGAFSKEALARRMKEEEDNMRREAKRKEMQRLQAIEKKKIMDKEKNRKDAVKTIKDRYSHLHDFFNSFKIDDPLMTYEDFVDDCCRIFQEIRASGKKPQRSWGLRTACEALPQEIWAVHHSYPSVKASGAAFRNLDPDKTGEITLKVFVAACEEIGYNFGPEVAVDLHKKYIVNDDFQ